VDGLDILAGRLRSFIVVILFAACSPSSRLTVLAGTDTQPAALAFADYVPDPAACSVSR
jgi:hypothetical protein